MAALCRWPTEDIDSPGHLLHLLNGRLQRHLILLFRLSALPEAVFIQYLKKFLKYYHKKAPDRDLLCPVPFYLLYFLFHMSCPSFQKQSHRFPRLVIRRPIDSSFISLETNPSN